MSDGYLFIATRERRYLDMARNAARSIRHFDKERRIAVATDGAFEIRDVDRALFDQFVPIERKLNGTEHHLYMDELSPWERTIYVDCDCLATSA